ncbi:MAG: hypothetical protein EPO64_09195, partial [Nitrospirae bacterium]
MRVAISPAIFRKFGRHLIRLSVTVLTLLPAMGRSELPPSVAAVSPPTRPPTELVRHLNAIAKLAQASPLVTIPAGWFLMGTTRKDNDPFGLETQYDDTESPQRRVWLDAYEMDRDEVSLAEYLAH